MKIACSYKMKATLLEYLAYIHRHTGVDRTKTVEKLVQKDAEAMADIDPEVRRILDKTPAQVKQDKDNCQGYWGYMEKNRKCY